MQNAEIDSRELIAVEQEMITRSSDQSQGGEHQSIFRVRRTEELISCSSVAAIQNFGSGVVLISSDSEDLDSPLKPSSSELDQMLVEKPEIPFRIRSTQELVDDVRWRPPGSPPQFDSSDGRSSNVPSSTTSPQEGTSCSSDSGISNQINEKTGIPFRIRTTAELIGGSSSLQNVPVVSGSGVLSNPDTHKSSPSKGSNPLLSLRSPAVSADGDPAGMPNYPGETLPCNFDQSTVGKSGIPFRIRSTTELMADTSVLKHCDESNRAAAGNRSGGTLQGNLDQVNFEKRGISLRIRSTIELMDEASYLRNRASSTTLPDKLVHISIQRSDKEQVAEAPKNVPNSLVSSEATIKVSPAACHERVSGKPDIQILDNQKSIGQTNQVEGSSLKQSDQISWPSKLSIGRSAPVSGLFAPTKTKNYQTLYKKLLKMGSDSCGILSANSQSCNRVCFPPSACSKPINTGIERPTDETVDSCPSSFKLNDLPDPKNDRDSNSSETTSNHPMEIDIANINCDPISSGSTSGISASSKAVISTAHENEANKLKANAALIPPQSRSYFYTEFAAPTSWSVSGSNYRSRIGHHQVEMGKTRPAPSCPSSFKLNGSPDPKSSRDSNSSKTTLIHPAMMDIENGSCETISSGSASEISASSEAAISIAHENKATFPPPQPRPYFYTEFASSASHPATNSNYQNSIPYRQRPSEVSSFRHKTFTPATGLDNVISIAAVVTGSESLKPQGKPAKRKPGRSQQECDIIDKYNQITEELRVLNQTKKTFTQTARGSKNAIKGSMNSVVDIKLLKQHKSKLVCLQRELVKNLKCERNRVANIKEKRLENLTLMSHKLSQAFMSRIKLPNEHPVETGCGESRVCFVNLDGELEDDQNPPAAKSQMDVPDSAVIGGGLSLDVPDAKRSDNSECRVPDLISVDVLKDRISQRNSPARVGPSGIGRTELSASWTELYGLSKTASLIHISDDETPLSDVNLSCGDSSMSGQVSGDAEKDAVAAHDPGQTPLGVTSTCDRPEPSVTSATCGSSKTLPSASTSDVKTVKSHPAPPKLPWTALSDTSWDALYR